MIKAFNSMGQHTKNINGEVSNKLEKMVNQNDVFKDSLREVLQDGIGDNVKCVSEEIETYGRNVYQTLKNMDWEIREPIQIHG
ncbi:hypothetical protein NPX89_31495, partial [Bacillus mycoides]|nr:hypothetical protein [Bacillus mycoides]